MRKFESCHFGRQTQEKKQVRKSVPVFFTLLILDRLEPSGHHDCATCCAERCLRSKLAVERSETVSHGSSPAGGAILIGQKCNLCQKALFYKAFSVF